jgi:hypothetical protein
MIVMLDDDAACPTACNTARNKGDLSVGVRRAQQVLRRRIAAAARTEATFRRRVQVHYYCIRKYRLTFLGFQGLRSRIDRS